MEVEGGGGVVPQCFQEPVDWTGFEHGEHLPPPPHSSGEVYRARHGGSGFECVFKVLVIPIPNAQDIQPVIQGIKEAWNGPVGTHPGICALYGCTYDAPNHRVVVATEFMDGLSLRDHMRPGRPIPERVVGSVVSQLVDVLAFLHSQWHRAHRDLKPGNILLNRKGEVKVTDLGQSRQLQATLEQMSSFVGTQQYMSPQRIQGATYTSGCDVWSLGLIAQQCILGEFPYDAVLRERNETDPSIDIMIQLMEEGPPPPLPAGFGAEAREFCRVAMEFDDTQRPSSRALLEHPFVVGCADRQPLGGWVAESLAHMGRA